MENEIYDYPTSALNQVSYAGPALAGYVSSYTRPLTELDRITKDTKEKNYIVVITRYNHIDATDTLIEIPVKAAGVTNVGHILTFYDNERNIKAIFPGGFQYVMTQEE